MSEPVQPAPDPGSSPAPQIAGPPILDLAPPPKSAKRNFWVIGFGLGSTVLALALVYILQDAADVNVMGWYVDYFLPVGAVLVGLVASAGYALAAWKSGLKIRRGLLLAIVLLQVVAYLAAQYTEFAVTGPFVDTDTGRVLSFPEYFHLATVNTAWKDDNGKMGQPLGAMGYGLRLGELVGFVLGTLVSPFLLSKQPYCELCEQYMKSKSLALLPASNTKAGHLFGKKAGNVTAQEAMEAGMTDVTELVMLGSGGDVAGFAAKVNALMPQRSQAKKLTRRIDVRLVSCARCASGRLEIVLSETRGRHVNTTKLGGAEVNQEFVRQLRDRKLA